tara:strand:- start:56 stop:304 length:249 start_codon:yes stop_codon:yes gene_type:complete
MKKFKRIDELTCGTPNKCSHLKICNECFNDELEFIARTTANYEIIDIFWWFKPYCSDCDKDVEYKCILNMDIDGNLINQESE